MLPIHRVARKLVSVAKNYSASIISKMRETIKSLVLFSGSFWEIMVVLSIVIGDNCMDGSAVIFVFIVDQSLFFRV